MGSLSQVPNVLGAFFYIDSCPECLDAFYEFSLGLRFLLSTNVLFEFVPQILDRVEIWRLCWGLPPVYAVQLQKISHIVGGMLRVVVLHKPVGLKAMQVWYQSLVQDLCKQFLVHRAFEDTYPSRSSEAGPLQGALLYKY